MSKEVLVIQAQNTEYSALKVENTLTVAELREFLEDFDDDMPVVLSFDGGYTYGPVRPWDINSEYFGEDEDE